MKWGPISTVQAKNVREFRRVMLEKEGDIGTDTVK